MSIFGSLFSKKSYAEPILAQGLSPHAARRAVFDAMFARHFKTKPAPDDETFWNRVLQLSPGERAFFLANKFSGEVHNGGFHQFFDNGGFRRAYATVEALELFGFSAMAGFLRRAIEMSKIPNPLPEGYEFEFQEWEGGLDAFMDRLGKLDSEFFKARTNVDWDERILDYVRTHPDEFV
jgi:hypothetical protein